MSSGKGRGVRVRGGGQGRGKRRGRGDGEGGRGDGEGARRAEYVGERERRAEDEGERRVEDVGERERRAEDVGRGEDRGVEGEEMERVEGNGIVERERVEHIRRDGQRGRGGRGVRGWQGVRGRRGRRIGYTHVSNEIRATLIDHVINHGLSLREAGQRVQPNINRSTVASIIRTFQRENR